MCDGMSELDKVRALRAMERLDKRNALKRAQGQPRRRTIESCQSCIDYAARTDHFPWHDASSGCESGKREHCTCDICF